jgi:hypothetical protein
MPPYNIDIQLKAILCNIKCTIVVTERRSEPGTVLGGRNSAHAAFGCTWC